MQNYNNNDLGHVQSTLTECVRMFVCELYGSSGKSKKILAKKFLDNIVK